MRNLLRCADTYMRLHGGSLETVGRYASGDPPFFRRLRDGGKTTTGKRPSCTMRKYDESIAWFAGQLGADMPKLDDPSHSKETTSGKKGR